MGRILHKIPSQVNIPCLLNLCTSIWIASEENREQCIDIKIILMLHKLNTVLISRCKHFLHEHRDEVLIKQVLVHRSGGHLMKDNKERDLYFGLSLCDKAELKFILYNTIKCERRPAKVMVT